MTQLTAREAINAVLHSELGRDRRTVYLGETIRYEGATGASKGLYDAYGPQQIIECPVSENGIFGVALGLALAGFRPIVEIYSADFALAVANEIMNDIPKWRQQQASSAAMPITIRGWMGSTLGLGPEHSQCMEAFFHHAPGLTVICPGTSQDMAGLMRAAIRSDDPVLLLEHRRLYETKGEVSDDGNLVIPIGKGEIVQPGKDVTIVAWAWMRHLAVDAARLLQKEGISAEIIDPRTIKPMDFNLIAESARKTGRLLIAEEAPITGNIGAEIIARVCEMTGQPIRVSRVAMADMIHPYSAAMEVEIIPDAELISATARKLVNAEPTFPVMQTPWQQAGQGKTIGAR
jgi:pyruvate/2-oxoglutarate/acetoin dehydrogenase E1 component